MPQPPQADVWVHGKLLYVLLLDMRLRMSSDAIRVSV
jgi:hypothetical protein